MSEDIGLQRAIYASLQQQQNVTVTRTTTVQHNSGSFTHTRTYTPGGQSAGTPMANRSRDIAPTIPNSGARGGSMKDVKAAGRRNVCQKEGILPSAPGGGAPRPHQATPAKESESTSLMAQYEPGGAFSHLNKTQSSPNLTRQRRTSSANNPTPTCAAAIAGPHDKTISQRSEKIPGWFQVVKGGKIQRQNPAGTHVIAETDEVYRATSTAYDGDHLVAMISENANVIGRASASFKTSVRCMTRHYYCMLVMAFQMEYNNENGCFTTYGLTLHFDPNGMLFASVDRYEYGQKKNVLDVLETLEKPVSFRGAGRGDSFNVCVVLQKGSVQISINDERIFKNVACPKLDPQSPSNCIGIISTGGKISMKNISLAEGDAASPPPNVDKNFASIIEAEIMERSPNVQWEDVAALSEAKRLLNEAIVLPLIVPEFFTGIRSPWKGVLLFGPPGTGKTMLAKAVATCAKTTFFNMSAATLLSRYHGESEKMVKCLFQLARQHAPSTIFFDEIDALMSHRSDGGSEHEASRRLKSEMLSQIDGIDAGSGADGARVMILATTNKPWDLDEAMRRRLEKRIYIALPDKEGRYDMFRIYTKGLSLSHDVLLERLAEETNGYSGADIHQLCRDAAMMPMRRVIADKSPQEIATMKDRGALASLPVTADDFKKALNNISPSVGPQELGRYGTWFKDFGST